MSSLRFDSHKKIFEQNAQKIIFTHTTGRSKSKSRVKEIVSLNARHRDHHTYYKLPDYVCCIARSPTAKHKISIN